MKLLLLGPYRENIQNYLELFGDKVIHMEEKINSEQVIGDNFDYIISFGYRYIIPAILVNHYENRIINLHISYLPWNKGADPNLWSFLEDTPKGVSIHYVDEGLDTGDIISQRELTFRNSETLASTYQRLMNEIEILFFEKWPLIRNGKNKRYIQQGKGSYHRTKDKDVYLHLLTEGWNTPVRYLSIIAKRGEKNE